MKTQLRRIGRYTISHARECREIATEIIDVKIPTPTVIVLTPEDKAIWDKLQPRTEKK